MEITEHIVNLDLPASKRWAFLQQYQAELNALLQCYLSVFEGYTPLLESIGYYKKLVVPHEYLQEIQCIAAISTKFDENQVLLANLSYDILKFFFGCTAFASHTGKTMLHSRNLDWPTNDNLLSRHSMIFNFQKGGKTIFRTVGWPGFVGALSGTKPGKFSLTLNAVMSNDKPEVACPVTFLLRDVLFACESYTDARETLEQNEIACDCLILLSGVQQGEHVVIERTPKRFATRESREKFIAVTNDYKKLENGLSENILQATSCGRYDRVLELLRKETPQTPEDCLNILKDDDIQMLITVQQMVFDNTTGNIQLIKTG